MNRNTKDRNRNTEGRGKGLKASLTVEAAAVMGIVLLSVMGLILFDFQVHDKAAAVNALICTLEMYSHRNKIGPWADNFRVIAEDTDIYITGAGSPVELESGILPGSMTGTVRYGDLSRTEKNTHLRAERLLRAATLAELKKRLGNKGTEDEEESGTDHTGQKQEETD